MITASVNTPEITAALNALLDAGRDLTPVMRAAAGILADDTEQAFEDETSPGGEPWAELSPNYLARNPERAAGQILQLSQAGLASSIQTEYDSTTAIAGTNKIYAALHQFGGLPDMPPGPAAVPAREYLGLSADGAVDLLDVAARYLSDAVIT